MHRYIVTISTKGSHTRLLLTEGPNELMRAKLPPPSHVCHERAVTVFLEGLSMWLDHKLHVVLSVDAKDTSYCFGLTDIFGFGGQQLFFDVEVHLNKPKGRARGTRIRGIDDFSELRTLLALGSEKIQ